jgi:phosphate starvation-inducible membrane PsiE
MKVDLKIAMLVGSFMVAILFGIAAIWNAYYFIRNGDEKRYYILGKGFVAFFLCFMYSLITIDAFYDIINYPNLQYLFLLRIGSIMAGIVFVTDAWMRNKI